MYLVPSTMHCLSAYKMYQQLVSNEDDGGQGDGAGHGGEACHKCMPPTQGSKIPSSFFSTTTLDELNAAIDTDHRRPSMENFNKGSTTSGGGGTTNRVYHFISNDDEEGNIVLLKDVISSDAKRYLGEMEVTIRERLNATYQRQVEVEKKASKCFVLQPECTDKVPHSAAQSNPELTISSATEDSKTSTSEGGVRPMKYTKRILQDRSALYAKSLSPTLSIPPALRAAQQQQRHNFPSFSCLWTERRHRRQRPPSSLFSW
ncbi:hypothetical protein AGDE_13820 [Angomonas deanei]|uniref:Ig-like domain-containing protein n=1 Tax=Angomonas deanei TaxID=59799 RepID=A0A7G2CPM5_9TRYP|nr:hypothetical protein AGDE_13820 [Angomonas deanei]CAD2220503.1 hypothetical protein, conserved [Angomonas deanei]|eukprot:EPY21725.1 hypothetical protein AGDE_13820 [Angomonas deanei]